MAHKGCAFKLTHYPLRGPGIPHLADARLPYLPGGAYGGYGQVALKISLVPSIDGAGIF